MKVGSLVRWFEMYADGIVKDGGIGVIVDGGRCYAGSNCIFWKVFRCEPHLDVKMFEEPNLKLFSGDLNENR